MTLRWLIISALLASPLAAETLLSAEEFDALTLGRTMTWSDYGQVYGIEEYLPDRRVRWSVVGAGCVLGHWYPEGQTICFRYENDPTPACWYISGTGSALLARETTDPPGAAPVVIEETSATPPCLGPEVGA